MQRSIQNPAKHLRWVHVPSLVFDRVLKTCTYFAIRGVRSFARIFAKKHPKEQHSKPVLSFTF